MTDVTPATSDKDQRAARLAAHLAHGVREGRVDDADALRVIRHELRRRNTNKKLRIVRRSTEAQRVIDEYAARGEEVPRNGSPDALHADHVHEINTDTLTRTITVDEWLVELERIREVVCVTAGENYALMRAEKEGWWGEDKYRETGVVFVGE